MTYTIKCDGDFNAGWLHAQLGLVLPKDCSVAFREGFDTAMETPSLSMMQYVMRKSTHYTITPDADLIQVLVDALGVLLKAPFGEIGDCKEWDTAMHGIDAALSLARDRGYTPTDPTQER